VIIAVVGVVILAGRFDIAGFLAALDEWVIAEFRERAADVFGEVA